MLAALVTDRAVLARVASKWPREGLFSSRAENLVAGWCVGHHRKYGRPPGDEIRTRYEAWAERTKDGVLVEHVGRLLQAASDDHARDGGGSSEYVIDLAGRLFDEIRLRRAVDDVQGWLDTGDVERARACWADSGRVDLGVGSVIRPGQDWEPWQRMEDPERSEPLFSLPGEVGEFLGDIFCRDSFVAIQSTAKRGKSWLCQDLAYRAARARCRVAYFEAGDLSESQVMERLGQRALRRPVAGREGAAERRIDVPVRVDREGNVTTESRLYVPITAGECYKAWRRLLNERDRFRLTCHPNGTLSADAMAAAVADWAGEGWVADVVVLDYADILAPPEGTRERRDQINESWMRMRRLSQEMHCLVLTATQSDAASYDARVQRRKNFSEDRRKHDHVTCMFALNQDDAEKERGVMRVNILDKRSGAFSESRQCWVAGCLAIGCPIMLSTR